MKIKCQICTRSILAGIFIGLAGLGYLVNPPIGMFLFILGLSAVVSYEAKLFTGLSGYVNSWKDALWLFMIILPGNLVGCFLVYLLSCSSTLPIQETAMNILQSRLDTGPLNCGVLGIGCGVLMTTAVHFAKGGTSFGHWVPLLFAVPLFIHCGFPHCIADAFYYMVGNQFVIDNSNILLCYLYTIIGNFIGCNIPRILI